MIRHPLCRLPLAAIAMTVALAAPAFAVPATVNSAQQTRDASAAADTLRRQIIPNWNVAADLSGVNHVKVLIRLSLDRSARISGEPVVTATGGPKKTRDAIAASALSAVIKSAPFTDLPPEKYDDWKEVVFSFTPSDLAH